MKNGASSLVYTPNLRIPIGEAIKREDGTHALRVKNPRTNNTDDISLESLFAEDFHLAEKQSQ